MRIENGIIYITTDEVLAGAKNLEIALNSNTLSMLQLPDDTNAPKWVAKIRKQLHETVYFDVSNFLSNQKHNSQSLGYAFGLMRWSIETTLNYFELLEKKIEGKIEIDGNWDDIEETVNTIFWRMIVGDATEDDLRRFHTRIWIHLQKAYFKWPIRDAGLFYKGLSRGLQGVRDENGNYLRERDNTRLLITIWVNWPSVKQLKSRSQLYNWLCFIHGRQVVGEYKRIEKICERYSITFRKPGRPKKNPDSKAIT